MGTERRRQAAGSWAGIVAGCGKTHWPWHVFVHACMYSPHGVLCICRLDRPLCVRPGEVGCDGAEAPSPGRDLWAGPGGHVGALADSGQRWHMRTGAWCCTVPLRSTMRTPEGPRLRPHLSITSASRCTVLHEDIRHA